MELTVLDRIAGIMPDIKGLSDYFSPIKRNEVYLADDTLEIDGFPIRSEMHLRLYRKKGKAIAGTLNYISDTGINVTSIFRDNSGEHIDITVSFKNIEEIGLAKPDEFGVKLIRIPFEKVVTIETLHSRSASYVRGDSVSLIPKGILGYLRPENGRIEDIIGGNILINNKCINYRDLKAVLRNN